MLFLGRVGEKERMWRRIGVLGLVFLLVSRGIRRGGRGWVRGLCWYWRWSIRGGRVVAVLVELVYIKYITGVEMR